MDFDFSGEIWHWRGPAPFCFVSVPRRESEELKSMLRLVTYGWGMIPITARIGKTTWKTAMWPKDGLYIVPLKASVRKAERLELGAIVSVHVEVG